ncbi:MAG: DeoR/GlpR family DNA-binding transcription regulator [Verrucomicrobiota bacterium]
MFAHERHNRIICLLSKHRRMDVGTLRKLIDISPATLRRDLSYLEQTDRLVRVHGGVLHPGAVTGEPNFFQKSGIAMKAKMEIAMRVAGTIPNGATVYIDSGTTCLEAGRLLRSRSDLTIITNSLPLLTGHEQFRAKLLVLGGELRGVSGALVGDLARASTGHLRADISLIGASGLHPLDGVGTTELLETAIKRDWISRGTRRCLLADASKWHQNTSVRFAEWNEFTEFYTDKSPPALFRKGKLKVIIA